MAASALADYQAKKQVITKKKVLAHEAMQHRTVKVTRLLVPMRFSGLVRDCDRRGLEKTSERWSMFCPVCQA